MVTNLNDTLIYSCSEEEHIHHLRKLFEILRERKLYAKGPKCNIGQKTVEHPDVKISRDGILTQERLVMPSMNGQFQRT